MKKILFSLFVVISFLASCTNNSCDVIMSERIIICTSGKYIQDATEIFCKYDKNGKLTNGYCRGCDYYLSFQIKGNDIIVSGDSVNKSIKIKNENEISVIVGEKLVNEFDINGELYYINKRDSKNNWIEIEANSGEDTYFITRKIKYY